MQYFTDTIKGLSFQQKRILKEHEMDMILWGGLQLKDIWPTCDMDDINSIRKAYAKTIKSIEQIRNQPIDYSAFNPSLKFSSNKMQIIADFKAPQTIMGRCPCPSESPILRCCNLKTLDAVQQCSFGCSYCSIQSFYSKNQIKVVSDLDRKLNSLVLEEGTWHIGTGQSSDSLFLGDDFGTITALSNFAKKHSDIVIELKTKASRTDWICDNLAKNMVFTWSVNAQTISQKEEHLTATLDSRIQAAKLCSEQGHLVGFHIHPIVYFTDWKKEYSELVDKLVSQIDPDKTVMVGMGTLTFTKQNLKTLRESQRPTCVTKMPLSPIAGKYSYTNKVKQEMFSFIYSKFPQSWKDNVFFYLCMEDKDLWQPCLGRQYPNNEAFENDMKNFYLSKIKNN